MTGPLGVLLLAAVQASAVAAPFPQPPAVATLVEAFQRFCVATGAERAKFDAEVERAGLRKTSHPFIFSEIEFNRRWDVEGADLAYLDAPPPAGRSCGISATVRGGYDGDAVVAAVSAEAKVPLRLTEQNGTFRRWTALDAEGNLLIVNNNSGVPYFAITEIILRPARQPAWRQQ